MCDVCVCDECDVCVSVCVCMCVFVCVVCMLIVILITVPHNAEMSLSHPMDDHNNSPRFLPTCVTASNRRRQAATPRAVPHSPSLPPASPSSIHRLGGGSNSNSSSGNGSGQGVVGGGVTGIPRSSDRAAVRHGHSICVASGRHPGSHVDTLDTLVVN